MKLNTIARSNHRDWGHITDLVIQKSKAGLRAEASRGYLGVLWWALEPVLYMTVFYIAFAHVLQRGDNNFVIFLLTGLIAWKWFHSTLNIGSNSLMINAGLMNQVYVPKIVFPLTTVAINTFKFLIILLLFLLFLQFTSVKVTWTWTLLPVLVFSQLLFIMAATCLLAAIMPFFPDLKMILENILMMLLFLSGIFYDITTTVPEKFQVYFLLNPMASLIGMYRKVLLEGTLPDWHNLLGVLLFSSLLLVIALWLLKRFDRVYPKIVF